VREDHGDMTIAQLHTRLRELAAEREVALAAGLDQCSAYMDDLEDEIVAVWETYVGESVTAIACLRGELSGRLQG
jgi:hypothetical protein